MDKNINQIHSRFLTKIIKPLALLKFKLVEQLAMDNDVNDLLKEAEDLSIAFNHFPEINKLEGLNREKMKKESLPYQIMFDLGNGSKHGGTDLRKIEEQNSLHIGSAFEINEKMQFGFLGNEIYIKHFKGRFDFLETAISAATYIGNLIEIKTEIIHEQRMAKLFTEEVALKVSTKYQFSFSSWSFHFYRRDSNGVLQPSDLNGSATIKLWTSFTSDSNGFRWE
ncbi:MAG: hypothetical protein IPL24_12900 [Bacteroidetes bacterium]|nr:hypothetical protein [Bacteroidota bacterium]